MRTLKRFLLSGALIAAAVFVTVPKLYKMAQIRGFIPGRQVQTYSVLEKWYQDPAHHPSGRDTYWIRISAGDIRSRGPHRLNMEREEWSHLKEGDRLKLVRIPRDSEFYLHEGDIYSSTGNFVLDLVLLGAELGGALYLALKLRPKIDEQQWRPAA